MSYTIGQIAALLGLEYQGDGTRLLQKVAKWDAADQTSLIFLQNPESRDLLSAGVRAACVLAPKDLIPEGINAIFSTRPRLDLARAAAYLHPWPKSRGTRDATAVVSPDASVEDDVELGPYVVVNAGARIGKGSILQAGVCIGDGCCIGRDCILFPNVVLYPESRIGDRVVLHAGVVVGSDGFGYASDGRRQWKFPQVGGIVIEDDVEIGANTTIDRGSLGTTRIGAGSKLDNLVQVAHNVEIGKHVVIASQTGISGSTVIEDYAVIGGQVGFGDHARVQSGAVIGSKAGVLPGKIVRSGDVYWGVPVRPLREYKRLNAYFGRLPEMKAEIDALKKEVAQLKDSLGKK
ncbi:MAG: UDP-3-O-(3-hydroxymyristoyl)glucosamine N-acyltransferase [Acidobacteriota bacterium]|nr:UDP-3-O-(3-hydroxymyristoyl)glucosamine N-acyltransferase [Acidobacteriota bacterium]